MATFDITQKAVILRAEDDVAVAKAEIPAGTILEDGGSRVEVRQDIKPGHKVARHAVRRGEPVRRYGAGAVVPAGDVEALTDAARTLLEDPDALDRARAGAERARQELTWDAAARAHLDLYRSLA